MPIDFSAIMGGPELDNTPIDHIVHSLGQDVGEVSVPRGDAELIIIWHVPGKVWKPNFRGVRIATFSRKKKALQVEISVSQQILSSPDILKELGVLLKRAISKSKKYLTKKGVQFSEHAHQMLVDRMITGVEEHRHLWPERKKLRDRAWLESFEGGRDDQAI